MTERRYNIRAVEQLTGVPAPTIRSWERRHGFPTPSRSPAGRRLYSDQDVDAIRRVRTETARGLSVAQAVAWARAPRAERGDASATPPAAMIREAVEEQLDAIARFDERAIEAGLSGAFSRHPADHVLLEIIAPTLVRLGEMWSCGEAPIAAEHFYSNIVRRRLLSMLAVQPVVMPRLTAALACLPSEEHELGLLMLALFLRWAGAEVVYLGASLPLSDLLHVARRRHLDAICLSAGREARWAALDELTEALSRAPDQPAIFLGGAAAADRSAPAAVQILTDPLPDAARRIVERR